jgi:hypothetical protein
VVGVPRGKIPLTRFDITELDGRKVLRVEASRSYGNLVHALPAAVPDAGMRLRWRWRLDQWTSGRRTRAIWLLIFVWPLAMRASACRRWRLCW